MKTIRWQMVMEGGGDSPPPFLSPDDVESALVDMGVAHADREHFVVFLLDAKHKMIASEIVSVGILDGALVHPREVFKGAVAGSASSIIVAHNHPSGNPEPSTQDNEVYVRLKQAGEILGIPVLDFIIVGPGAVRHSFHERAGASRLSKTRRTSILGEGGKK